MSEQATAVCVHELPRNIDDEGIYRRIFDAIVERRLPPGAKLGQDELGEIFGVSKTRIRPILYQLAAQKMVTMEPRRGAFVARPSLEEARAANAVRQILEDGVVRKLARSISPSALEELRQLVRREEEARLSDDRYEAHRLTGYFHVHLASFCGNAVLSEMLEQLVSRDSLAVAMYQPRGPAYSIPEHLGIIAALQNHDPDLAAERMRFHLQAVVDRLDENSADREGTLANVLRVPPGQD